MVLTFIFFLGTLLKIVLIIIFIIRIIKKLKNNEGAENPQMKALLQFFLMCGIIIGISIIEFGLAFILPRG